MSVPSIDPQSEAVPEIQGHVIGFMDSTEQCQQIAQDLQHLGVDPSRILILAGDDGLNTFRAMLSGYSWGEESEQMARVGEIEFGNHHAVLCVQAERDEGMQIAELAQSRGGHGFRHFGVLADERLTA